MASLPVPSTKKLGKYKRCCSVFQILLKIFLQAVHCALFRSPCVNLVHQTADKNGCVLPHKNFISSVSFNTLYSCLTYYFHCLSACPVCWTGRRAIFKVLSGRLAFFTVPSVQSCFSETALYSSFKKFSRATVVTSTDLVSGKGKTKEVCCCDKVILIILF